MCVVRQYVFILSAKYGGNGIAASRLKSREQRQIIISWLKINVFSIVINVVLLRDSKFTPCLVKK